MVILLAQIGFLAGVALGDAIPVVGAETWPIQALIAWWLTVAISLWVLARLWPNRFVRSCAIGCLVVVVGGGYNLASRVYQQPDSAALATAQSFIGTIVSFPEFEGRRQTFAFELAGQDHPSVRVRMTTYREPVYVRGQQLAVVGAVTQPNPGTGTFDYQRWLVGQGFAGEIRYPKAIELRGQPSRAWQVLNQVRDGMLHTYRRWLPEPAASLAAGLALGIDPAIDQRFQDELRVAGLTHLAAVSGQNLSLTVLLVFFLVRRWWLRGAIAAAIGLLILYTVLVGAQPSILRADMLALAFLAGPLIGRPVDPLRALMWAATLLTAINPLALTRDVGFQLSFMVFASILIVGPVLAGQLKKYLPLAEPDRAALATVAAAGLAVLPIQLAVFGGISLVSPLANLVVAPLVSATMLGALLVGLLGLLSQPLAALAGLVLYLPLKLIQVVTSAFASLPGGYQLVTPPSWLPPLLLVVTFGFLVWHGVEQLPQAGPAPAKGREP